MIINPRARLFTNRRQLLEYVPWTRDMNVAEIGVAFGEFSVAIIDQLLPKTFHAVDLFNLHTFDTMWGSPISDTLGDKTHHEYYCEHVPTAVVHIGNSWDTLRLDFETNTLDFAYLDAAHDHQSVTWDLIQLWRIIKPGGHLMLDDYTTYDPLCHETYGVLRAVNEFFNDTDWQIVGMSLEHNGFHNLLLKKPR